jgi:trans-aconitate methyltransferase
MSDDITNFNRSFYNENWGKLSDYIKYNPGARHRRRIITWMLKRINFSNFLDVGCGNGALILHLKKSFPDAEASGADLSDEVVNTNQTTFPFAKFYPLNIVENTLDKTFQQIVCSEVIEHIEDRSSAFKNLASMLDPKGHLLMTCPAGHVFKTEKIFGHISHPTIEEMRKLGEQSGLKLTRVVQWGWPFYTAMKWATNVNADWTISTFAETKYGFFSRCLNHVLYALHYLNTGRFGCQVFYLYQK